MRKLTSYSIEEKILIELNNASKKLSINKSRLVENLLIEWLKKQNGDKNEQQS